MRQSDEKKIRHKVLAPGITRHPFIRSGSPCIAGTGLRVTDIVTLMQYQKMQAAEIAAHYELEQSQVDDALTYYAQNTEAVDADIQKQIDIHEQLVEAGYGRQGNSLLSR